MKRPYSPYIVVFLLLLSALPAGAQTKVEITGGEKMYGDQVKKYLYIVRNVVIKHGGVTIQCDSAIRKTEEGIIEGFGNIYIYQPDTFTLSGGEYLRYVEEEKIASVTGKNVVLSDRQMNLSTTSLSYNTASQTGYYTSGAVIVSDNNTLSSKRGHYNRRGNVFHFKENVVLRNPEYVMNCDTLDYMSGTSTAVFQGPTRITGKENSIQCRYGWYNTRTEKAAFSRRATLFTDSGYLTADSLFYDRKAGSGNGFGNIRLFDSSENIEVYGQTGTYSKKNELSVISGDPLAVMADGKDTMYLLADTLYFRNDSTSRELRAFNGTRITQREFQGACDSLVYDFRDSSIRLFTSPILWNEKNQISGDSIRIKLKGNRISRLLVTGNAFLASEVKPGYFNQIAGKEMINSFDSNKLKNVKVEGNAQSIYYLRDNETDTAQYTGVNKVACSSMLIALDSSKVRSIRFFSKPEGKIYPVNEFPEAEKNLPGLSWRPELRPVLEQFTNRTIPLKQTRVAPAAQEKPTAVKRKVSGKKKRK